MINKLFQGKLTPAARDYSSNPEYQACMNTILQIESRISRDEMDLLTILSSAYAQREAIVTQCAFSDGFSIATGLLMEAFHHPLPHCFNNEHHLKT
jgi:hypothetical protein